jgi:hypothetical protein
MPARTQFAKCPRGDRTSFLRRADAGAKPAIAAPSRRLQAADPADRA